MNAEKNISVSEGMEYLGVVLYYLLYWKLREIITTDRPA